VDDERTARVKAHIEHSSGRSVESIALAPLPGGAVQESFDVRVEWAGAAPLTDALPSRFVLRSDTPEPLPASLDRRVEYGVVNAAVAAGVPTPEARWLADGLVRPGAWAYLLDFAQGTALGRKVVSSAQLAGAREGLTAALANALTRIHHVPLPTLPHELESPRDPAAHQVSQLREMSERLPHRRPACEYVLCWLEDNLPSPQRLSLVHGDFRTGNFLVSPAGL
jgi:aminoglycoside phosphotransferase (APT) family kinase protein